MKKAKILLAAIGILAIVGGAYAFKTRDLTKIVFIRSITDPPTVCRIPLTGITTIPNNDPTVIRATTTSILPCVLKTFYKTS